MFAELYLTNGSTKIDLLGGNRIRYGFHLMRMTMSRPQRDPSGAFRQAYGAVNEVYELRIGDLSHNGIAARQRALDSMLEQARNYFNSNAENTLIWLVARTLQETNTRYAVVYGGVIEAYGDVYGQPFVGGSEMSVLGEISLGLERSAWLGYPPLEPVCLPITNDIEWNPNASTWVSNETLTGVQSMFTTNSSTVLAGGADILRTEDNGDNWTNELTSGTANLRFWQFEQEANGRIWAVAGLTTGAAGATSGLYYSDDDGSSWTQHTASEDFYSVAYRSTDNALFFGGDGVIKYIKDGGSLTTSSTDPVGKVKAIALSSGGAITAGDEYNTWRIPNNSLTAVISTAEDVGPFLKMLAVDDYVLLSSASFLSVSRDDGKTWSIYWREWGVDAIVLLQDGTILASQNATDDIFVSRDGGFFWEASATLTGDDPIRAFAELEDIYIFAGADATIYRRISLNAFIPYGPYDLDCTTPVYVANHRLESNWTHILIEDESAATFETLTPADVATLLSSGNDHLMFPSPIAVDDAFYVGISTSAENDGAFNNLFVRLTERNFTLVLVIEYWDGAAWTAFSTTELRDNTSSLHRSGVMAWHNVVLATTAVNSITAYWVRFRVTDAGTMATAIPTFDNLYIVQQPYIEFDNVAGDIPAIAQIQFYNMIDDGNGNAPSLPNDAVIMGLRSVERGEKFTAFLNIAPAQNPFGITASVDGVETTFVTDRALAAAGQYALYVPDTLNAWGNKVAITLNSEIAKDYNGTYQVYLRLAYGGFDDTVSVRLVLENFSNQGQIVGDEVVLEGHETSDFANNIYLGQFSIMPDRYLSPTDEGISTTAFRIQLKSSASGFLTYDVAMFELILIPADEWIGTFEDSTLLAAAGLERYVDIDSATFPKRILRSTIRERGSEKISGIWNTSATGVFALSPGLKQRLWILMSQLSTTEEDSNGSAWTIINQVKLFHNPRWLGLRGTN